MALRPIMGHGLFILEFLDNKQRWSTVGRTPLDEWSARRTDLYLTRNNTHNRQTSMAPAGFEPAISAGERQQANALDCAATGTGEKNLRTIPEGLTSESRLKSPGTTSCRLVNSYQCFGENCCPPSRQAKNIALKLEAINSSEMSVTIHQSTRCCIPEGLCIQYWVSGLEVYKNTCLYFST